MQVANGVEMLEIAAVIMGKADVIYPVLIWDEETAILVDTGYPGQLALFREAMAKSGVPFERLNKVILTHQDVDHIGGLPAMLNALPQGALVLASELEKPFIQGEKRLLKITPETIEQALASLPAEVPAERRQAFRAVLENPPKAKVDQTVADGEELPYCGGMTVVITPGHTPGHVCLYHRRSKTLIAGDALQVVDGQLVGPDPRATLDMAAAMASLKKLTQYEIEAVICYHSGLFRGDATARIADLA
ncbi:MAG TPA: MBL fold metallo-hydrolase [Symbiobacteriaceae bacterium]|jgi:glyoxylase-like metal-dependent hydrolase (beta-lactamase superfamily II)